MMTHKDTLKRAPPLILEALFWFIGIALILSSIGKIIQFKLFLTQLSAYQILPPKLLLPSAIGIMAMEFLFGVGFLCRKTREQAASSAIILFIGFSLAMAASLLNHRDIECACSFLFLSGTKVSWSLVSQNLVMALLLIWGTLVPVDSRYRLRPLMKLIKENFSVVILCSIFIVMSGEILYLVQNNNMLKATIQKMAAPAPTLKAGEKVPPLTVKKIGGEAVTINYADAEKTTLLVFSTTCPPCKATVPYWNEQYSKKDQKTTRVIGLSGSPEDELAAYVEEKKIQFPVYYLGDPAFMAKHYKIYTVPQKIEIDKNGTVISTEGIPDEVIKKLEKERRIKH